jgi:hypothetical protein
VCVCVCVCIVCVCVCVYCVCVCGVCVCVVPCECARVYNCTCIHIYRYPNDSDEALKSRLRTIMEHVRFPLMESKDMVETVEPLNLVEQVAL